VSGQECEHKYTYLRSEEERDMWGEAASRVRQVRHYDVFFCERCLQYRRLLVKRTDAAGRVKAEWED
jgi:hypothetical protein